MNLRSILSSSALALALLLGLAVPAAATPGSPSPCSQAHRVAAYEHAEHYIDVYNSHDLSRLTEVVTPDSINTNSMGAMDLPALVAAMEAFYGAFPDLEYSLVQVVVDGDRVVYEYTYTGTHQGEIFGIPATGTVIHGRGLEVHTLGEDGRIVDTQNYSDLFLLLVQLGGL